MSRATRSSSSGSAAARTRRAPWAGEVLTDEELVRGHHVDIGTPKDNTTARFGQTIYAYLALAFATNFCACGNSSSAFVFMIPRLLFGDDIPEIPIRRTAGP